MTRLKLGVRMRRKAVGLAMTTAAAVAVAAPATAEETFKLGLVNFLSGPAADAFGVPSINGGELMVDALNAGDVPAPYDQLVGFGGMPIEIVQVDEAGGARGPDPALP